MIFIGIIIAIIIFSVIVLVHEYGHFKSARIFGVKVLEFGLGIPPKAKNLFTDKKGTIFTLNWLPIGGFVRLKGEVINESEINDSDNLNNKAVWKQSIIMLAGIFMNFVLAIFIFSIIFFIGFKPLGIIPNENPNSKILPTYDDSIKNGFLIKKEGVLMFPLTGSIAGKSGIKDGDLLKEVNGIKIKTTLDAMKLIGSSNKINILACNKDSKCKNIEIIPSNDGKIGTYLQENLEINKNFKYKYGFFESIKYGTIETYDQIHLTFFALGKLAKNIFIPKDEKERDEAIQSMSGPIGIVNFISKSIGEGVIFLFIITGIISINLGVFNLLPIPALDGGRFFLILLNSIIKAIFGKKIIGETFEGLIHLLFFVILIALSLIIGYNDILKLFN